MVFQDTFHPQPEEGRTFHYSLRLDDRCRFRDPLPH